MSGTCDALEFVPHTHIRDRAASRWLGLMRKNCARLRTPHGPALSCSCPFCSRFLRIACFSLGIQWGGNFRSYGVKRKSREAKQECPRHSAQMRRTRRAESDWSALLGDAARSLGVLPVPPPLPDLSDPELYLDFFGQPPDFAAFLHESRHPSAVGSGINSKSRARAWIREQICVGALHPEWRHRPPVGQLGINLAKLFNKIGYCWLPICVGPTAAPQSFACWNTITDSRTEKHNWVLASDDPMLKVFFENVSRARIRLAIEKYRGQMGSGSLPQDAEANIIDEPAGDEK